MQFNVIPWHSTNSATMPQYKVVYIYILQMGVPVQSVVSQFADLGVVSSIPV